MRTSLVAGNWKMNGTRDSIKQLLDGIKTGMGDVKCQVAVCVPSIYIANVKPQIEGSKVALGAEDVNEQEKGAYTGEISTSMLKDFSVEYVIVGHSERRDIYKESDELVAKKFAATRVAGMIPILCVGELLEERESNITEQVVARQLKAVIDLEGIAALADCVIAYEPVWAIGTGKTASPEQAQAVHAFIRGLIAEQDKAIAEKIQILYGGSVKGSNAVELFAMDDIDGGLIGGASLMADDFLAICRAGNA
ncbi:Triosephosphate isomerase [hydrothermal vent metagenome]|uniref:triose-phosphate isomerase n=1 Tax=hydrothermal vent metagenome TaxID=652676 RepID=A0A3B1A933_9ZZZZ